MQENCFKQKSTSKEKEMSHEEYAKLLYNKYKHQISLPYDRSMPFSVFVIRALDHVVEEFDKSVLFERWISLKQFQGVDYQSKIVHQSLTPEGYSEPPTLAAAITSSIFPSYEALLQGKEAGMDLEFLIDILKFHRKFNAFGGGESSSGSKEASDVSRNVFSVRSSILLEKTALGNRQVETS